MNPADAAELARKAGDKAAAGLDSGSIAWLLVILMFIGGAAYVAARWVDKNGAKRRKRDDEPADSVASNVPGVRMLASNTERLANHVKELANMQRDSAFAVERCTAAIANLTEIVRDSARETRGAQTKTAEHLGVLEGMLKTMANHPP